ncbi:hypothetical protein EMIT0158MI4_90212 [Burkholderia ambifaria]
MIDGVVARMERALSCPQLCDSRTSFQLIWDDGARNLDAITLGAHVSRDRQRRPRVHALWHLQADASQVAAPLPGGGRRRSSLSKPSPSDQPESKGL